MSKTVSVASKEDLGTSVFNMNDFYRLQRNTEGFYSCLICTNFIEKYIAFLFWGHFIWAPIAFECYHFYSGCDYVYVVITVLGE